jgi:hypothetical protein
MEAIEHCTINNFVTGDMGGKLTTNQVTEEIVKYISTS